MAPIVDALWRLHLPRSIGALIAVSLLMGALAATTYFSYNHALDFAKELPRYRSHIQALTSKFRSQAETLSKSTESVLPQDKNEKNAIYVRQATNWTDFFGPSFNSVTELGLAIAFIPFLVYFMLSWQDHVRAASVMLFKMENRNTAYVMLGLIAAMIRSFIVGNFIIGLFLSASSIVIFGFLHLPYFYFLGVISGFLSLVPYLGVILAVIPPLVADLGHLSSGNSVIIIATVLGLHLLGMNVLYPKILGKRLSLNPLAVTLSLLFWGWLWGAMGLMLAVPIMGAAKIIFDHVERLRPYGAWLGE
jgi:predicted PurR-regulated permease PerM